MGLVTLRHGTDLITWFKIHAFGAKTEYDKSHFSDLIRDENTHVFTLANSCDKYGINYQTLWDKLGQRLNVDQQVSQIPEAVRGVFLYLINSRITSHVTKIIKRTSPVLNFVYSTGPVQVVMKRVLMHSIPTLQKTIASYHLVQETWLSSGKVATLFKIAMVSLLTLITPTVRFRFHPNQVDEKFTETYIPGKIILLSSENISPFNIGLIGSIKNCVHSAWPPILRAPVQVLKGTCVLVAAAGVGYGAVMLFPGFVAAHQTAIVAGARVLI